MKILRKHKYMAFKYAYMCSLVAACVNLEDLCGGRNYGVGKGEDVVEFLDVQWSVGFNVGMLLVICFVPRYGAYRALRSQKGEDRS